MTTGSAAQLAFAAEFALFLVAVAGLACALRPGLLSEVPWARSLLAAGFLGLATASFLRGAVVVGRVDQPVLVALRVVGGAALALGLTRWRDRRSALALLGALALLVAAGVAVRAGEPAVGDGIRSAAAVAMATALVSAARRSISARITVSAAGLVLAVVLVVAVAVSLTISHNVEGQAADRYASRAASEADAVAERARSGLGPARVLAGVLARERADVLLRVAEASPPAAADASTLSATLTDLVAARLLDVDDPVLLVTPTGAAAAAAPSSLPSSVRLAVSGDPVMREAVRERGERQGVTVVGRDAFALAVVPVLVANDEAARRFAGVVVVARRLDATYLRVLGTGGERLSFALALPRKVVATTDRSLPAARLRAVAAEVVERGARPRRRVAGRFLAAAPVEGGNGRTVAAFVVSAPSDVAEATRASLFRTLFVVALGAALVAVVLASLVGERIGRGLQRLTVAAQRMQAGELDTTVAVRSDDELGALGGAFSTMAGSIRDKNAELRAAAAQEGAVRARLQAVVAGMSEALVAVDPGGAVLEVNRAAEQLLDVRRTEAVGRPVGELVRRRLPGSDSVAVELAELVDGQAIPLDLAVGNQSVPVVVTAGVLRGAGGVAGNVGSGVVLVVRDVRREREVDDLKSSILANIGHELRTPLTPIKGYAGMLRDRRLTPDQTRSFAGEIVGGVDQLERVVRQLVTFATIAAGNLDVDARPLEPFDLADRLRARWQARLDGHHTLAVSVEPDAPEVLADAALVDQALDELVDNAVKYSPDGGPVTVVVGGGTAGLAHGLQNEPSGADQAKVSCLAISVVDQGVGISPDRLADLASSFSQGDPSNTRRFGGLGLGLACADRIVSAHGGRLAYESTPGEGTTVTMLLPAFASGKKAR